MPGLPDSKDMGRRTVAAIGDFVSWRHFPLVIFLVWALWLSAEYLMLGPFSYVRIHDNADVAVPIRQVAAAEIRQGHIPLWLASGGSGADLMATLTTIDLDLAAFVVLPSWLAYGLWTFLQRFIAGFFTCRVLREQIELDLWPAVLGGMAYSFFSQPWLNSSGGGFTLYDGLAGPGLPFFLWALVRLDGKEGVRRVIGSLALGLVVAFTTTFILAVFFYAAAVLWFVLILPRRTLRFWSFLAIVWGSWFLVEFPFMLPAFMNAGVSHRAIHVGGALMSETRAEVFRVVWALRSNWLLLALGCGGLLVSRARGGRQALIGLATGVLLIAVVAGPTLQGLVGLLVPSLSSFQMERMYITLPFFFMCFGAAGAQALGRGWEFSSCSNGTRTVHLKGVTALALAAAVAVSISSAGIKRANLTAASQGSNHRALFGRSEFRSLADLARGGAEPFRVAVIVDKPLSPLQPGMLWESGLETNGAYLNMYSGRFHTFWQQVLAPTRGKPGSRFEYFRGWGNRVYLFLPTGLTDCEDPIDLSQMFDLELLSVLNTRFLISTRSVTGPGVVPFPVHSETIDPGDHPSGMASRLLREIRGGGVFAPRLYVYENRNVLPRFFLVSNVRAFQNEEELYAGLANASVDELSRFAFVRSHELPWIPLTGSDATGYSVRIVAQTPSNIELETSATGQTTLVSSVNHSKFWVASVDGVDAPVVRVNGSFLGLPIPSGTHRIRFQYRPPYRFLSANSAGSGVEPTQPAGSL